VHHALLIVHLPLAALSGEVESPEGPGNGSVGVGVISVGAIVLGWVGLFALWWFVFRDKERARRKRKDDPPPR
jgi:hypothetical protein